ncbi:MAG TPA: hypothetical protein DHV68_00790 [Dehalococcoidia bacterium]|nr:hypothetical protein [Chloroflexota bacterium]HCI85356.1 hypothetical protein [Dehalococcoidia bacterium]|tara:strand:+ start:13819 stop:15165 length:1347 start_codon:yes stop_codon:yes gene_type:complete
MKTLKDLKMTLVGGLAALILVAVVACTGTTTQEEPEPPTDQITVSDTSTDEEVATEKNTVVTITNPTSDDTDSVTNNTEADPVEATAEVIPAVFDNSASEDPNSEVGPYEGPQEASTAKLTAAKIVAAQQDHLVNLYEKTVESVVFIYSRTTRGEGSGSGFVWDEDGHVVTNYHVIQNAGTITVRFFNGREYRADIVAQDPAADLAVIKLIGLDHELTPISIGTSSELRPGDTALALGNPFGQDFTMTTGIVSAIARTISSGFSSYSIPSVIQTDAAINPGNSGGPLLDLNGAVIGVNTQIVSETAQSSGVGFAVPVDLVKRVVPSLIEIGEYVYPLMGISGNEVELTLRENVGLPANLVGAYVTSVSPNGPADLAGIRGDSGTQFSRLNFDGDVIVSINSVRMESMDDLIGYLALNTSPGEEIIVGVFRDGVEIALPMTLGSRPTIT